MTEQTFEARSIDAARAQPQFQAEALRWLQPLREQSLAQLAALGFPTRKTETWRYTSIYPLTQGDFLRPAATQGATSDFAIAGLDSYRLVFLNGSLDEQRSQLDGLPFEVVPFSRATVEQQEFIRQYLGTLVGHQDHPFALLNAGWLQEGLLIRIAKEQRLDKPIQVVFDHSGDSAEFTAQPRLLVQLERHSEAVLIEQHLAQPGNTEIFTNTVAEIFVGEGALLTHYQLNLEPESVLHVGNVQVSLAANAQYESHQFSLGGKLKRRDLEVNLTQPGANARLFGVYMGRNSQHVDYRTVLNHRAAHCTSEELVKGLLQDEARAVFNGRIHIYPNAQQTSAEMNNRNLLLSKNAEVNTKPELEIYADDVKCAHGATVGQLDQESLFYLRSRGIASEEAYRILSDAFVYEVLARMPQPEILTYVSRWVEEFHGHTVVEESL